MQKNREPIRLVRARTIKILRHFPSWKVPQIASISLSRRASAEASRQLFESHLQFRSHRFVLRERFQPFHHVFAQRPILSAQNVRRVHHVDAARFDVEFRFRARETDDPSKRITMRFIITRRRQRKKQKEGHHHRETRLLEESSSFSFFSSCGTTTTTSGIPRCHSFWRHRRRRLLLRVTFGRLFCARFESERFSTPNFRFFGFFV